MDNAGLDASAWNGSSQLSHHSKGVSTQTRTEVASVIISDEPGVVTPELTP